MKPFNFENQSSIVYTLIAMMVVSFVVMALF